MNVTNVQKIVPQSTMHIVCASVHEGKKPFACGKMPESKHEEKQ